ncbi:ER membrane protein complex subunit 2-like isoform X2 [Ostrea edulis]|uniref:ER membrane protein complex subunit 2-like isoform X2 n=1 Tax=Ostrea edulis TaxID=37623 RepID=UPI0024AEB1AB|nr:ER membrane protein complex subunit 2-like isoform X2 [Ostrea edulis]
MKVFLGSRTRQFNMARHTSWEEARNHLRRMREDQIRDGQTVVSLWEDVLMSERNKLGEELWTVYEQVCVAALDCCRIDISETCIELLKAKFPRSVRVKRLLGMTYEAQERYNKATELYDELIKDDETNMFARKRKVAILKAQNKTVEAIEELNRYLKLFMTDFEAWMELCDLYLAVQDYTKAAFCIEELIMSNPHNHLYHQKLAEIKYTMGDPDNMAIARTYFAQAIKLNPNSVRSLYGCFLASCNLAASSNRKDKQSNIKYAAWAAQQLKEKYTTVQPEDLTNQTRVLESIERVLESLTEKTAN